MEGRVGNKMNIELKDRIAIFNKLIIDQFAYGGQKYAQSSEKEATDCLFEAHGYRWLIGTIDKYTYRYKNLARERDLLKIGTYMYILWLKRGYHLNPKGTLEVINTTVPVKQGNFDRFIGLTTSYMADSIDEPDYGRYTENINRQMEFWSEEYRKFGDIYESEIFAVYKCCFMEWLIKFSDKAGQDTDTNNEKKNA